MSAPEEIKMRPNTPLSCALYSVLFLSVAAILGSLVMLRENQMNDEDMLVMYFIFSSIFVSTMTVVAFGHGFGSNDEKFIFLVKGKQSPLMRTRAIYFNEIKEILLLKDRKNRPVNMKVITDDKIYCLGQRRVINRFVAILSAKKMSDKIRETKEDISLFQRFKYWWRDGDVEDLVKR